MSSNDIVLGEGPDRDMLDGKRQENDDYYG
jgi:hypothetical protein